MPARQTMSPVPLRVLSKRIALLNVGGTYCCDCTESFVTSYLPNGSACHSCRALSLHISMYVYILRGMMTSFNFLYMFPKGKNLFQGVISQRLYWFKTIMCSVITYLNHLNHPTDLHYQGQLQCASVCISRYVWYNNDCIIYSESAVVRLSHMMLFALNLGDLFISVLCKQFLYWNIFRAFLFPSETSSKKNLP